MSGRHSDMNDTRFKWALITGLIALVFILGTIQELAK